jgi:hypothetical protein
MSIGFPQGKEDINQRAGQVAVQLRDDLLRANQLKAFVDGKTDAQLLALGFVQGEVDTLRASATDMNNLFLIAHAQGTQASVNDFFFNAKNLTGVV